MARNKSRRTLSDNERKLWQTVAKTITPLNSASAALAPQSAPSSNAPRPSRLSAVSSMKTAQPPLASRLPPKKGPVMDTGDPRQAKKVARGRLPIGATLDLHGMTQLEAEMRLRRFLAISAENSLRIVLVITGKGTPDGEMEPYPSAPRGIIRRRFLEWVETEPLRGIISSVRQSHQRHGGRGAFYVFLRP